MLQSKRPNAFFRSLRDQPQRRRPPGLSGLSYDVRGRLRGNVTADLRIAILEAFQEAGILIAFWVTETLEVSDQAAFLNVIKAVPATLQPFGGKYIVLGGKIAPGEGSPPRRITIVAFDSLEKAQQWFDSPEAIAARTEAQKFAKIRSYFVEGVAK